MIAAAGAHDGSLPHLSSAQNANILLSAKIVNKSGTQHTYAGMRNAGWGASSTKLTTFLGNDITQYVNTPNIALQDWE